MKDGKWFILPDREAKRVIKMRQKMARIQSSHYPAPEVGMTSIMAERRIWNWLSRRHPWIGAKNKKMMIVVTPREVAVKVETLDADSPFA